MLIPLVRIRRLPRQALALALLLGMTREGLAAYRCPQSPSPAKTDTYQGFLGRVYKQGDKELPYRLFVPKDYKPGQSYPLVLYLHHAGLAGDDSNNESGWDNCVHLTSEIGSGDDYGGVFTHRAVDKNGTRFDTQQKYPHFVLAPHAKSPSYGFGGGVEGSATGAEHPTRALVWAILDQVRAEYNIDPARLYVTGISMGCYGTWDIIMRNPGVFAAASPQSCRGDPNKTLLTALKNVPIWSMCGTNDSYFAGAQKMADVMKEVGATAFQFTAMQGVGHSINDRGYDYPGFIDWMFAQHRTDVGPGGGAGGNASGGVAGGGSSSGGVAGLGGNSASGGVAGGGSPSGGVAGLGGSNGDGGASASGGSAASGGVGGLGSNEGGTGSAVGGSGGSSPQSTGGAVATGGNSGGASGANSQAGNGTGGGQVMSPTGGTTSSGGVTGNGHLDETSESGCSLTRSPGSARSGAALLALVALTWRRRWRRQKTLGARE
jgi:hypothetical protein